MTVRPSARLRGINQRYPFGTPDGSRANLKEIMDGFVGIEDEATDLGDPGDDLSARIIVGRMGSGKTLYLRRSQAFAANDHAIYADDVRSDLPSTQDVIRVCHRYESRLITETWTAIWRKALLRALASHLLFAGPLRLGGFERQVRPHRRYVRSGRPEARVHPREVAERMQKHRAAHGDAATARRRGGTDVAPRRALHTDSKPCTLLDAYDEQFAHRDVLVKVQKGLFSTIRARCASPASGHACMSSRACATRLFDIMGSGTTRDRDEPISRAELGRQGDWNLLAAKVGNLGRTPQNSDVAGVLAAGGREIDNADEAYRFVRGLRRATRDCCHAISWRWARPVALGRRGQRRGAKALARRRSPRRGRAAGGSRT